MVLTINRSAGLLLVAVLRRMYAHRAGKSDANAVLKSQLVRAFCRR
jgi:hypothetical protein